MIIGNSLGYPLCNALGSLLHPVDSTGYRIVEKTVVLGVTSTGTGSAKATLWSGILDGNVYMSAFSTGSAVSATVHVPETASWRITLTPSTPRFKVTANGVESSASNSNVLSSISYVVGSGAPDVINIDLNTNSAYGYTVTGAFLLPNRFSGTHVQAYSANWEAALVIPDSWSAEPLLSSLRGEKMYNAQPTSKWPYSAAHYHIDAREFSELSFTATGAYQFVQGYGSASGISAILRNDAKPYTRFGVAVTTGFNVRETYRITANIPTASALAKDARYVIDGAAPASDARGWLSDVTWQFSGVVK